MTSAIEDPRLLNQPLETLPFTTSRSTPRGGGLKWMRNDDPKAVGRERQLLLIRVGGVQRQAAARHLRCLPSTFYGDLWVLRYCIYSSFCD